MSRNVSNDHEAWDAAKAGEVGHVLLNRLMLLHDRERTAKPFSALSGQASRDREEQCKEYWTLRARAAKAIGVGAPGEGDDFVRDLLNLDDNLFETRGITFEPTVELRAHQRDCFWVLRSRIARDIEQAQVQA